MEVAPVELSTLLNVIGTAAVLIGIVFGLTQLRHYHLSRKRDSALYLLNSYQTGEFSQGIRTIMSMPENKTKDEIEKNMAEDINGIYRVMNAWESIGILLYQNEITLDMVTNAYRGPIVISWKKLELYVSGLRQEHQADTIYEWFQWLAERILDQEESSPPIPAYIAHRDWKSKSR